MRALRIGEQVVHRDAMRVVVGKVVGGPYRRPRLTSYAVRFGGQDTTMSAGDLRVYDEKKHGRPGEWRKDWPR